MPLKIAPQKEPPLPWAIRCYGRALRLTYEDLPRILRSSLFDSYRGKNPPAYYLVPSLALTLDSPQPGDAADLTELYCKIEGKLFEQRARGYLKRDYVKETDLDNLCRVMEAAFTPFRAIADGLIPCQFVSAPPKGYQPGRLYISPFDYHLARSRKQIPIENQANGSVKYVWQESAEEMRVSEFMYRKYKFVTSIPVYLPPKENLLADPLPPLIKPCHDWLVAATRRLQADFPELSKELKQWAQKRGIDLNTKLDNVPQLKAYPFISMEMSWLHFERINKIRPKTIKPPPKEIVDKVLAGPSHCDFCDELMVWRTQTWNMRSRLIRSMPTG